MNDLHKEILTRLSLAQEKIYELINEEENYAYVLSFDYVPGVWETSEALGIISWQDKNLKVLYKAIKWLIDQKKEDGGFAPWPDISCRTSCVEPTTRVVLSMAPVIRINGFEDAEIYACVCSAVKWILNNQDELGGWGAYKGLKVRVFPTAFAILALNEALEFLDGDLRGKCYAAIIKAKTWLSCVENDDGGYGLYKGLKSNVCSTSHVAWSLARTGTEPSEKIREFLRVKLSQGYEEYIKDDIKHPAKGVAGRFYFLLLTNPVIIMGLLSCKVYLYDVDLIKVIKIIFDGQVDGVWHIPDKRFVWPSYFYVNALRLWLNIYMSHNIGTSMDLSRISGVNSVRNGVCAVLESSNGIRLEKKEKRKIFISYATRDSLLIERISRALRLLDFEPWVYEQNMKVGDLMIDKIIYSLQESDIALFIITGDIKDSPWISFEMSFAIKKKKVSPDFRIMPILYGEDAKTPDGIADLVWKRITDELDIINEVLSALKECGKAL